MADFAALASTTNYLTLLGQISDRDAALALALDPATATVTTPLTGTVRWNSANKRWEIYNGASWAELIAAATDAFNMTVTGLKGGTLYGTTTNTGTISGGTVNAATLQQAGSAVWTAATLTNLNQLTNGPGFITTASLGAYAPLAGPALTGVPTAPTAAADTSTTQLATTAFVVNQSYLKAAAAAAAYLALGGGTLTGTLNGTIGSFSARVVAGGGSNGYADLNTGSTTNSGYLEFVAANGNRQGYIGFSSTTSPTDTGTILFAMGTANFSGVVSATSFSGAGTGLTGTAASLSIGGNAATASAVAWSGITGKPTTLSGFGITDAITAAAAAATYAPLGGAGASGTWGINVTGSAGSSPAGTLTGSTLAAGVTASSLTSLGTLGSLSVSGAAALGSASTVGGIAIGYRGIPANAQSTAYSPTSADIGKSIDISAGGITVTNGVFGPGDTFMVTNMSGSNQTITQSGTATLRLAGTTTTGSRTLLPWGCATLRNVGGDGFIVSGNVT